MAEAPPTLSDRFATVVDLIKHEDNLVNLRTNWTLVIQGVLFTAFATTVGLFEKFIFSTPRNTPIHVALFLLCGLGAMSCIAAFFGVRAAEQQQIALSKWWQRQIEAGHSDDYPPLYRHDQAEKKHHSSEYFLVFALVWLIIFVLVILSSELILRSPTK